jgi:hypothetical protein
MKTIRYILSLCLIALTVWTCADDEKNVDFANSATAPTNLAIQFDVTQDNTGLVTMLPTAEGAVSFDITFGDSTPEPVSVENGESLSHNYGEGTYTVSASAFGVTGLSTTMTQDLVISFQAPENIQVTVENDLTVSKQVNVTVTADFAVNFEVYSGESGVVDPVVANIGETANVQYAEAGVYDITIIVMGAAIETTTYMEESFEVTSIEAPTTAAPTPQPRQPGDVISIFSAAYDDLPGTNLFPDWGQGGQGSSWSMFVVEGDLALQYINLSYQGIEFAAGTSVDVSNMDYLHLDVWTTDVVTDIETSIINNAEGVVSQTSVTEPLTAGVWTSLDIPISDYTDQGQVVSEIFQLMFVGEPSAAGTVFIDNIYFYKEPSEGFDDGLLTNGDFELGSAFWMVGVDSNSEASVAVDNEGNTHFSTNVTAAGNPWDVNTSQFVELINGETYTLIFDAWSDTNRDILAGIGLSADPWTNVVETTSITTARTTYSFTFEAIGFGAAQARVIFDLGGDTGVVNLDNVALFLGDGPPAQFDDGILNNGDFQNGSESWLVGVDDDAPANVITDSEGSSYYYTEVGSAGNPWDVNLSQKVEIIQGNNYRLTFDAWSDTNRSILAGIGLSGDPWTNAVETFDLTLIPQTFSVTFEAVEFGDPLARVLFDLGAEAGAVIIDNVSLIIE